MKHSLSGVNKSRLRLAMLTLFTPTVMSLSAQQTVSLEQLMQWAETESYALATSRQGLQTAANAVEVAKSQRLPDVSAEAAVGYLSNGILTGRKLTDIMHVDNPHITNRIALRASQTVYSGGTTTAAIEMARINEDMARLSYEGRRDEVRYKIAMEALNWALLENRMRVVDHNITLLDTLIRDMQNRLTEGLTLETDLTRLQLTRETWLLERTSTQNTLDAIRRNLGITLHRDFSTSTLSFNTAHLVTPPSCGNLSAIKAAAAEAVGVNQSALEVQLSEQRVRQAQGDLRPKVAVMVEGLFDGPITTEVPVINKNIGFVTAGIGVSYPLSGLWKGSKRVKQAKSALQMARDASHDVEEATMCQLVEAEKEWTVAIEALRTEEARVKLAEQHYAVTRNRYVAGLCLLTEMVDAENTQLDAQLGREDARIRLWQAVYRYRFIAGTI